MILRLILGVLLAGSAYNAFAENVATVTSVSITQEVSPSLATSSSISIWENPDMVPSLTSSENVTPTRPEGEQTSILGGGCFWCLHHDMSKVTGVSKVESGYAGGTAKNPTYETYNKPAAGEKSHVEVVRVTYDPQVVSYEKLLDAYFQNVDPTDALGQFCDRGEEYRPIIVVNNASERKIAEATSMAVAEKLKAPVFVEIMEPVTFWPAEAYHQDYAAKNQLRYQMYRWNCGRDARVKELGLKQAE